MKLSNEEYHTSDLYYAAFLSVSQVPLLRDFRDETGKVFFVFENINNCIEELKKAYFTSRGKVQARKFVDEIKNLKNLIYA